MPKKFGKRMFAVFTFIAAPIAVAGYSLSSEADIAPGTLIKTLALAPLGFHHSGIVRVNTQPDGGGINGDGGAGMGFGDAGFEGADPGGGGSAGPGGGGGDQGGEGGGGGDGGGSSC